MTTPQNTSELKEGFFFEDQVTPDPSLTVSSPINSGDLVYIDQSTYYAKPLDSDANAQYLKGMSVDTWPVNVYGGTEEQAETIKVRGVGVVEMKTTVGEAYYPDLPVYIGADAQTVTLVAGSYKVGAVAHDRRTRYGLTGAAGVRVPINLRRRVPGDVALA
jgi:hypothetical protein